MEKNKGEELWKEAKKLIPGGSQLLSKRAELFLPEHWPAYYSKAKGVDVWDIDGKKYIDMSIMGVGACILGYADKDVNEAVKKAVDNGSMCTLNCPEEVELAKLLLELHPWAGMVRYAKAGGEAMSVAVRIARAYSKKDKIAFCGYHGWNDWYLAANLADDKNLDGHLIPGLAPTGVPRCLKGTAIPFEYNDIDTLRKIIKQNYGEIGVIVLEPIRHQKHKDNFIKKVAEIAKEISAVLIFDEITTGWRLNPGGAYKEHNVNPDIVVYGKAMANGLPISAIVGKKDIMDAAQTSFISSTFWTERTGTAAAIVTIKKIISHNVPEHLIRIGKLAKKGWAELAKKHGLKLEVMGIDPLATFHLEYGEDSQLLHTLFTQEMLKRGYLASKQFYVSYSHNEKIVSSYLEKVDEVLGIIKAALEKGNAKDLLEGPVAHTKFKRLN
ncbi:aminotransferase class III-fold pyridoxal phosphate-dependent enzyme [Candidatus Woesearchaeota archaeon]|nr:aminotransferase class III-fold pyridoxal phosphate-dependent enzyme [Candidatus Woesearchaeota archaeon]